MRIVPMPPGGLHRAGRWGDVERFPQPAAPIQGLELTVPLLDGPRWEDPNGNFATVKCSRTGEAAVGRVFARYRPRRVPVEDDEAPSDPDLYGGLINRMLSFFSHNPDYEHEPELTEGIVPPDIFDRLCEIHLPSKLGLSFIDIADPATLSEIASAAGNQFERLGLRLAEDANLARERDRRLPRLVLALLYERYRTECAGVRVPGQPDEDWESFVLWSPAVCADGEQLDLAADNDSFRYVATWDDDAVKAAATLGVQLPEGG